LLISRRVERLKEAKIGGSGVVVSSVTAIDALDLR